MDLGSRGQLLSWLMTQEPWSSMLRIELVCPQLLDPRSQQVPYAMGSGLKFGQEASRVI